ncbi:efflux RND transporter periplasmic adaptor subunit [Flavobacterium cellulosilyticum]|uniref:Efflux RND transporter periplasmic adaptor subunit n=1 Tax=Flavobacterium cellulosilyticum TaxID=2541731 RepID=A0A4R5C246_9FLAO|nr:efflux RND transporter periplasmic adaptor subunit [Flavobacterium cellulosilyticum]TDD93681.1 efflux RND transporter periplasmic adaptor subunit [Flavobacterium cellulosilyticum]
MKKIAVITGLLATLFVVSCNSKKEEKEEVIKYAVTNPMIIDTSFTKQYVSQIKSVRNIEIRSQEKGFLQNIYVEEGQSVKAGQIMFRVMSNFQEADLLKTQAEVKAAEIELQNTKILADKNIVSKNELAMALTKLQGAKAEVTSAKLHLSYTVIKAPFSGTIDRIPKKLGSLIEEGELLTSLSDNSGVYAYFNLSEPEYLNYQMHVKDRADKKVSLLLANNETYKDKGIVELVEGEFDSETGNIAFRARFPNPDKLLRNGETGSVIMTNPIKNALVIPQKTTYEIQDRKYVFVIDKNNVVKEREIKIIGEMPDIYIVKSGINENDKILLEGVQKVKDNDKIEVDYQKPEVVLKHLSYKAN